MEELNVVENQVMEETALNEVGLVVGGALGVRALVKHHKNKKNEVEVASTEDLTTDSQESDE